MANVRTRMEALRRAAILDTPPEPEFDVLTSLATRLFDVPMSILTFVDEERQWFKSRVGLRLQQTPRAIAFCESTIAGDQAFVVEDASGDPRFAQNPLVLESPKIRFYAGAPVHDPDGVAIGSFAVLDDHPRRAEPADMRLLEKLAAFVSEALRRRAEARDRGEPSFGSADVRLSFLADRVPALLWTTDRELRVTSAMGGALATVGLRPGDVVGRPVAEVLAASAEDPAHAAHVRALGGEGLEYQTSWHARDYVVRLDPLCDANGNPIGTIGLALDVTERRRLEVQVLHADRLASMGILVAGIAHEMNNPLSYCIAGLEVARDVASVLARDATRLDVDSLHRGVRGAAGKIADAVSDALDGAWRATQLVRDMLLFARQGEFTTTVDVRQAIETSIRIVTQPMLRVARLRLDLGDAPPVHATASRLVQVFVNLLINAVQAVSERPSGHDEIGVTLRDGREQVVVEVSDTGPGIPPQVRDRIFDPFFSTKPTGIGTGLGLSICQRIVTEIGGRIEVDSQPGRGTTFRIVLPAGQTT